MLKRLAILGSCGSWVLVFDGCKRNISICPKLWFYKLEDLGILLHSCHYQIRILLQVRRDFLKHHPTSPKRHQGKIAIGTQTLANKFKSGAILLHRCKSYRAVVLQPLTDMLKSPPVLADSSERYFRIISQRRACKSQCNTVILYGSFDDAAICLQLGRGKSESQSVLLHRGEHEAFIAQQVGRRFFKTRRFILLGCIFSDLFQPIDNFRPPLGQLYLQDAANDYEGAEQLPVQKPGAADVEMLLQLGNTAFCLNLPFESTHIICKIDRYLADHPVTANNTGTTIREKIVVRH
mmetsp:Transcript_37334/g.68895  ORF Transcript_37334/g.68895 Transcript_37334/m.68895 type:complete len:293 (-) Transcript_37334:90-968(-)